MSFPLFLAESGGLLDRARDVGQTFGFNSWLFISQACSFSIVCILLHKFAYHPILAVLEERRRKIEQGLEDARKSKERLAESEKLHGEKMAQANVEAQRMIDEAKAAVQVIKDKGNLQATAEAEQIVVKARAAAVIERDRLMAELRREVTRLVVDTTAKVSGKVLTADDQRRLSEEASREIAA